jgi:hypothetical protein
MATPKLKLGNDKWATKQRSLLAFNDEGNNFKSLPFQVERLSGGSYVGRNGLIQYAATEEPRIDFTNYSKGGLLLEPQRTNGCLYSKTLSSWAVLNGGSIQTITDNDEVAPDGTTTASTLEFTSTGSSLIRHFSNTSYTSAKHSCSFWAKKVSGSGSVFFGLTDTETEFTPTDEWVRYEVNNITPTNFGLNLFLDFEFIGSTGDKIAVWGMQFEAGTYSTSTIPTAGSTATRIKDLVTDGGNEYVINNTAGTLFLDCELAARGTSSVYSRVIICRDTTTTTRIILDDFSGNWRAVLVSGGTDAAPTIVASSANTRIKLAITYDNTGVKTSYNGTDAVFTSGPFGPTTTMNKIKFSNAAENGSFFNGWVNDFQYFDEVLTDAELKTLTTL